MCELPDNTGKQHVWQFVNRRQQTMRLDDVISNTLLKQ